MAQSKRWSEHELLLAFRLYCRTPFGRLHRNNAAIIELAERLDRTPSAVVMKACNFASLDPHHKQRGVAGLGNVSRDDRELWERFVQNPEAVAAAAEQAAAGACSIEDGHLDTSLSAPDGLTEVQRVVRVRRVQSFFRAAVLSSYDHRCALTGMAVSSLLNASHIIPWNIAEARRADPRNGICLNTLHDRAFDRGLITFDENHRLVLASSLKCKSQPPEFQGIAFNDLEGAALRLPDRFRPDPMALEHHREHVFERSVA